MTHPQWRSLPRSRASATQLTVAGIQALKEPGKYGDGDGLYLIVKRISDGSLSKYWFHRYTSPTTGERRSMGIGNWPVVSLAEARDLAITNRRLIRDGIDPLDKRAAEEAKDAVDRRNTIRAVSEAWFKTHGLRYKQKRTLDDAVSEMRRFVYPIIGGTKVEDVETTDILKVLDPIWPTKTSVGVRVRWRLETILTFAAAKGMRDPDKPNPARSEIIHKLLGAPERVRPTKHLQSYPWRGIGEFVAELRKVQTIPAYALEFQILTGGRRDEVRKAEWSEVDFDRAIWTVPAARMKNNKEWRVPLSPQAIAVLRRMEAWKPYHSRCRARNAEIWVFPGERRGGVGVGALTIMKDQVVNQLGKNAETHPTVHGFRGTLKQWSMAKGYSWEVQELALSHTVGNQVSKAYQHSEDFLDLRRKHICDWANWCGKVPGDVVLMKQRTG